MIEVLLGIFSVYPLSFSSLMLANIVFYFAVLFRKGRFVGGLSLFLGLLFAAWVLLGGIISTVSLGLSFGMRELIQLLFSAQYLFLAYYVELDYVKVFKWMVFAASAFSLLIILGFITTGTYLHGFDFMTSLRMWGEEIFPLWPNGFGAMLSFSLWLALSGRYTSLSICKISALLITIAAILTSSRSTIVGVVIIWTYFLLKTNRIGSLPKMVVTSVKILMFALCLVLVVNFFFANADATLIGRVTQISDREEIGDVSSELILDHPIAGYGGQTLEQLSSNSGFAGGLYGLEAEHTHNMVFEIMLRHGVVGFVLLALFFASLICKRVKRSDDFAMLACLFMLSLTQDYIRNFCFLFCIYLIIHYEMSSDNSDELQGRLM